MKRLALMLSIMTIAAPLSAGDTPSICGTGVLRDVEAITETIATRRETRVRVTKTRKGDIVEHIESSPGERREKSYLVTVEVSDMVYTGRSAGDAPWNFNPTRLIVNDEIGVCVYGSRLILKRPDGKNYKLQIVRAVRTVKDGR